MSARCTLPLSPLLRAIWGRPPARSAEREDGRGGGSPDGYGE